MTRDVPASRVAVVIPALNARATLPRQLECLLGQEDAPPFEVLVCDNGSTDGTRDLVAEWGDRLDIRLVDCSERRGAGFARNAGVRATTSETVLFCDADDLVGPTWVLAMSSAVRPGSIVAGPVMRITDETPAWTPPDGSIALANSDVEYRYMNFLPCVLAGSLAMQRTDFLAVGGFDNSYRRGCEDVDFSWRAQLAGMTLRVADGCVIYYSPRDGARATFAAERGYTRTSVLLWLRYRDQPGITGMSLSWSAGALARAVASARPATVRSPVARRAWAARVGANLGSVEGHLSYRLRRGLPPRETLRTEHPSG